MEYNFSKIDDYLMFMGIPRQATKLGVGNFFAAEKVSKN